MAQSFAVAATTHKLTLSKEPGKPRKGSSSFVITNSTSSFITGRLKVIPIGETKEDWFTIEPQSLERNYAPNESFNVTIDISVPETVAAGTYQFRLDAFSEQHPHEDYTEGQTVDIAVEKSTTPSKAFPWWILFVIGGGLLIAAIIAIVLFTRPAGVKVPDVISESEVKVPDVIGKTETAGIKAIQDADFTPVKAGERDRDRTPGTIVETDPSAETIARRGSEVQYWVQSAPVVDVTEDCLQFQTNQVVIRQEGNQFLMTDGRSRMKMFPNRAEAEQALRIIRHYNMNSHCFVGRPGPSVEYWLVNNSSPQGAMSGEDCVSFNPDNLTIKQSGRNFLLMDGSHSLLSFPNRDEAETTRKIILKHRFNRSCFVGRPGPSMNYFRR
jgi:hypothetical protein